MLGIAKPQEDRTRINEQIRVPQVRVIDDDGEQLGIMKPEEAYNIIDQLIGSVSVNREVGKKRDEAMEVLRKLIPDKKDD